MQQVVAALEEEAFAKGECIVRQGEIGHAFYIVQSGEVAVFKRDEELSARAIGLGDYEGGGMGPQVGVLK